MRTQHYKTLKGLLRYAGQQRISDIMSFHITHTKSGWMNYTLPDKERLELANLFAQFCVKNKKRQSDMAYSLFHNWGDMSLFQCFFIELSHGQCRVSTSLSGEAHTYCVRKYLKESC